MRSAGHRRRAIGGRPDAGGVTVEFALGLPSLILVLAFSLSAGAWALDLEAAQRGAAEAARAAVVDTDATAMAVGARTGGRQGGNGEVTGGGAVTITRAGGYVTACVSVERPPWPHTSRCATARDRP